MRGGLSVGIRAFPPQGFPSKHRGGNWIWHLRVDLERTGPHASARVKASPAFPFIRGLPSCGVAVDGGTGLILQPIQPPDRLICRCAPDG